MKLFAPLKFFNSVVTGSDRSNSNARKIDIVAAAAAAVPAANDDGSGIRHCMSIIVVGVWTLHYSTSPLSRSVSFFLSVCMCVCVMLFVDVG